MEGAVSTILPDARISFTRKAPRKPNTKACYTNSCCLGNVERRKNLEDICEAAGKPDNNLKKLIWLLHSAGKVLFNDVGECGASVAGFVEIG